MLILYLHIEKTNYLEDRAVIFSDLMSRCITKDYYNDGTPINKKANLISLQIKEYIDFKEKAQEKLKKKNQEIKDKSELSKIMAGMVIK